MGKAKKTKKAESKGSGLYYEDKYHSFVSDLIKRKDFCYLKTHRDAFILAAIFGLEEYGNSEPDKTEHENWKHHVEAEAIKEIHDFMFQIITFRATEDYRVIEDIPKCQKMAEEFANIGWNKLVQISDISMGFFDDELFKIINELEEVDDE